MRKRIYGGKWYMKKKILAAALAVCMSFGMAAALPRAVFDDVGGISASADSSGLYTQTLEDGTLEITGYRGKGGTVTVPSEIAGKKVTRIGQSAFDCGMYDGMVSPTKIIVSEGITHIGQYAFYGCDKLESVKLPKSLSHMDNAVFHGCVKLKEINVTAGGQSYCSKDGVLYTKDYKELVHCPQTKTSITIPDGVEYIGLMAFESSQITSVKIPDTVTVIKGYAFQYSRLKSVNIPKNTEFLGSKVFYDCEDLESITVDSSNEDFSAADGVLYNKKKTTLIQCPTKKKSLRVPDTVRIISEDAFGNCKIESVVLPDSITKIERYAFAECKNLKSVKFSRNITDVGEYAFMNCSGLTSVSIPGGVVGPGMFMHCENLSSVNIGYGVSQIKDAAFYFCPKIKSVTIPSSVKSIGQYAFGYYNTDQQDIIVKRDDKVSGFTIRGVKGTAAEKYAKDNGFKFVAVPDSRRIAGSNRYDTAAVIAQNMQNRSSVVILASGEGYADALAGVPLARYLGAPILLTPKNSLSAETLSEIKRRNATKVIILGGEGAVSKNVESALQKEGLKPIRLAGSSRYGTAVEIAKNMDDAPKEIFFACAGGFADALSAGAAAALKSAPIIYLGKDGDLNAETKAYLQQLKKKGCVKNAYVIGGAGVISDSMMSKAASALGLKAGTAVKRIAGANRYETCLAVNNTFSSLFTGKMICVSTGRNFPDALAGGVYAAENKALMMLADDAVSANQKAFLTKKKGSVVTAFGSTGAVSDELLGSIAKLAANQ